MTRLGNPLHALGLLSIFPVPATFDRDRKRDISSWFPVIGLGFSLLGGAVVGLVLLGSLALSDSWGLGRVDMLTGALVVGAWAIASRFLHWDGLGDTADAVWGGHTPERRLEIMADSSVGAFGVIAIVLVALVQVSALGSVIGSSAPLVWAAVLLAVPVVGRLAATFACWLGTPARPEGLGSSVVGRPSVAGVLVVIVVIAAVTAFLAASGSPRWFLWWPFALLSAPVVPHLFASSTGGVTGDNLGASILCVETIALVAAALVGGL